MKVINSKEFVTNQRKYFDLAVTERILIKRGKKRFHLMQATDDDYNDDEALLSLAKSRINGEFTNGEEYSNFLNKLINEVHS